jgi:hypothetical protein
LSGEGLRGLRRGERPAVLPSGLPAPAAAAGGMLANDLLLLQEEYMRQSRQLNGEVWNRRSRKDRILQNFGKLFSAVL